jgi:hypothetical protein
MITMMITQLITGIHLPYYYGNKFPPSAGQTNYKNVKISQINQSRAQWPRGTRRGSDAARLLGSRFWNPQQTWMSVSCTWFYSDRRLCVGPTTLQEKEKSTLSLTSALDGGRWSAPCPGRFTPGNDPVPIV